MSAIRCNLIRATSEELLIAIARDGDLFDFIFVEHKRGYQPRIINSSPRNITSSAQAMELALRLEAAEHVLESMRMYNYFKGSLCPKPKQTRVRSKRTKKPAEAKA